MHQRKGIMCNKADAFIALPGGFGTLEELAEMVTWVQLGIHNKPIGILNIKGFYDPYLAQIDNFIEEGYPFDFSFVCVSIPWTLELWTL